MKEGAEGLGVPGQPGLNSKILSHEEEGEAGEEGEGKAGHRLDSSVQVNGSGMLPLFFFYLYLICFIFFLWPDKESKYMVMTANRPTEAGNP